MTERHTYLTTAEVADYLRLKERKVYDLVSQGLIPCSRATESCFSPPADRLMGAESLGWGTGAAVIRATRGCWQPGPVTRVGDSGKRL